MCDKLYKHCAPLHHDIVQVQCDELSLQLTRTSEEKDNVRAQLECTQELQKMTEMVESLKSSKYGDFFMSTVLVFSAKKNIYIC
jgi:hypothetical protein